ncbi:hypothetical protein Gohar_000242 [Gossypium harknessii]|uniref:Golgi to ER traffic protein 4 homolog n=1 Tax=Gossypium harknessii TaxID=34285 RepID=A0A7J9I0V5_9ROSI|nr:hypothetical protein [Gossypium harknessii]
MQCYPDEDDIAIARAVLMYLSMGNLRDANCLMNELKRQVESQELDFPESDLVQFITFLLLTLERDALPLFNMLRVNYKSSIDREPAFNELLDEIAEKFYGVQRRNPLQGMFGDLLKVIIDISVHLLFSIIRNSWHKKTILYRIISENQKHSLGHLVQCNLFAVTTSLLHILI